MVTMEGAHGVLRIRQLHEGVHEGRADGESWIIEEGTHDWVQLKEVFPELVKAISEALHAAPAI